MLTMMVRVRMMMTMLMRMRMMMRMMMMMMMMAKAKSKRSPRSPEGAKTVSRGAKRFYAAPWGSTCVLRILTSPPKTSSSKSYIPKYILD